MTDFEIYKSNLDILDEFYINQLDIHNGVAYNGPALDVKKDKIEEATTRPLAAAVLGLKNTAASSSNKIDSHTKWSVIDAQEYYLNRKPTCFLIFGKPGVNAYHLGEKIAEKYNSIHLCPRNIINDELIQQSDTGKCIDFNMRHNNVCTFDVLLKILKKKLKSEVIKHRGYIISGFPIVTSDESDKYLLKRLHGEISLAFSNEVMNDILIEAVKKKIKEKKQKPEVSGEEIEAEIEEAAEEEEEDNLDQEEVEEEENQPIELPEHLLDTCSNIITSKKARFDTQIAVLTKQVYYLLKLEIQPDIIFYTTCPDADAVTLKNHKYINCVDNNYVSESLSKNNNDVNEPKWPKFYSMFNLNSDNNTFLDTKYLCKQPINFKTNAAQQLCNYNNYIYPFIEKTLQAFNPKRIIKLDGRLTLSGMMEQVFEKLSLLCICPVIIPKPLYLESEDMDEFWNSIGESNVFECDSTKFVRYASPWYNRCPVELKKRHTVMGKTKYAVSFLKYVFLLSSSENLIKFYINPRPYLQMLYLEPVCRICVIGSKLSGKSMIATCLSWIFDAPIIDFAKVTQDESVKKYQAYSMKIFPEIIASVKDERLTKWQNLESLRLTRLNDWYYKEIKELEQYVTKFDELILLKETKEDLVSKNIDLSILINEEETPDKKILIQLESNNKKINEMNYRIETVDSQLNNMKEIINYLPFLDDIPKCRALLTDEFTFKQFGPLSLTTSTEKPRLPPLIDDEDVKVAINNYILERADLQKEIEIKTDEVIPEVIKIVKSFDVLDDSIEQTVYGKWIIDNYDLDLDYWLMLNEAKLLPDITVTLIENREMDDDLMKIYTDLQTSVKFSEERYMAADDPLIKLTLSRKPDCTKVMKARNYIAEIILNDILNSMFPYNFESEQNEEGDTLFDFVKFRENWDSIQMHLEENSKCVIEVEIGNKTDIEVVEEVLLKIRQSYYLPVLSDEEATQDEEQEDEDIKNMLTYNPPNDSSETMEYCPIAYYNYGVLWKGKADFNIKFDNKIHLFCDENSKNIFENDVTKYQSFNEPLKTLPSLKICVIGRLGSGKSTISRQIAKELGLLHVDFSLFLNDNLLPRHYKKVGRQFENIFKDKPFDDEAVTNFEVSEEDENFSKFPSEDELRLMVYNYFELGLPLYSKYILKLIKILWFQDPYSTTGFVLDGFPKTQTDVECMIQNFCIPDVIIELQCDSDVSNQRISNEMFKTWKIHLAEAKQKAKDEITLEKKERNDFITKTVIGKLIFDDIFDSACASNKTDQRSSPIIDEDPDGSTDVDSNLFHYYKQICEEYPVPTDTNEWEHADDARERIETRIESIYEVEDENIETFKETLLEEKIKIVTVDASLSENKVLLLALSKLTNLKNRNESFFEHTFIVDNDTADKMLLEGFAFLSVFCRMCPVYIYGHHHCIRNPFKSFKETNELYIVLHRSYIYYMFGKENLLNFRNNPLKYILCNSMKNYSEFPLRISVIGPPKSGKSILTAKLTSRYGLLPISKGFALRYIMDYMPWTELALNIKKQICSGECVNIELIVQTMQVVALDYRASAYGYILDGFPETSTEAEQLTKIGLYPTVIFDLQSDKNKILQNLQKELQLDILKYIPTYSSVFVDFKFMMWNGKCTSIRDWIKRDCNNLYNINAEDSRWLCLQNTIDIIDQNNKKIHNFLINENQTVVPMDVMAISKETFQQRMSSYKKFCPICFSQNKLRHSGMHNGGKGIVLYNNIFYWVCDEHMNSVMRYPQCYLVPNQTVSFPEIPAAVTTISVSLVYENGVCIVTYAENLPSQKILIGDSKFAANYRGKIYLFCSHECCTKFLEKPHLYCDITVFKDVKLLPQLSLNSLPHLGYLEQTVGNIITNACCYVNVMRPKYPGLSIDISGVLLLALYLKIHNPLTSPTHLPLYVKANKTYEARCKLIHDVGLILRSMDNPLAKYPVCCKGGDVKLTVMKSSSIGLVSAATSRVPVPDERYDYLCQYHKPASKVPAFLNVVDIAGLVKGAAEGQGLGNAFLSHIKACDAIFNLCRAFEDEDVIHVDGEVNPVRDLETIGEELRLKDEEQLLQNIEKLDRQVNRGNDKKLKPEYETLLKIKTVLVDEKKHIRFGDWSVADIEVLNKYLFITSKPAMYLVNLSEKDYIRKKNKWLPKLKEWIDKNDPGAPLIPFSGVLEYKLFEMEPAEKEAFLKEQNITSALDKIIIQGYKALQLEYFFTAGEDEVKAWTIQKGTKAPQAAGRIHTDFEKGFIMAEVMHFKDFKEEGSEAACKSAGKYRQQGRNYVVEDGDIIFFKFNAGAGLKDAKKK